MKRFNRLTWIALSIWAAVPSFVLSSMLYFPFDSAMARAQDRNDARPSGAMGRVPDFTFKDRASYEHLKRAFRFEEAGDFAAAIGAYKEILKSEPFHAMVLYSIAGNYGSLKKYDEEVSWSKKAIQADPTSEFAYVNLGNGLCGLGQFEPAREAYIKAVKVAPDDPKGYYSLGFLEDQLQDWAKAEGWYRRSIEVDPKFTDGHFNLAAAYANQRKFDAAIQELNKVIALDPNAQDARDMLNDLKKRSNRR